MKNQINLFDQKFKKYFLYFLIFLQVLLYHFQLPDNETTTFKFKEINDALKTASKKGTGKVGFPEFVGISKDFIIVIEDKAELEKQANYSDDEKTELTTDVKSLKDFAENGALHYGKHIVENTNFKKIFAFRKFDYLCIRNDLNNRDVAQLVAYYVRDVGAGSSSLLTPT